MKMTKFNILLLSSIILLVLSFSTWSAELTGNVAGRISDANSKDFLPGANVMLRGTNFGDASDREGAYAIANVPPGTYTLVVTYIGYDQATEEVAVTAGKTTKVDVALNVSYVDIGQVVVKGLRQGQVKALSQQRTAANIINVVDQEQMERFPDVNTADVLQRVPGVFIERSEGEGRYAYIRGTAPGLTYVTVNGERLATNRTEERFPQLDIISSSQLASVEVVKAITPDMDGDAIGGAINLVTRSAFDYPGSRFDLTLGPGYMKISNKIIGQGRLNYTTQLGANKKIGLSVTANYDRKERGQHGMEFDFDDAEDVNDNPIPFALVDFDMRPYFLTKTRYGVGSGLEFRANPNHQWFVRGLYSRVQSLEWRGRWRIRVDKGNYLNPEGTLTENSRIIMNNKYRWENLDQIEASAGGLHKFGNKELNYTFGYSFANEDHPDHLESDWQLNKKVNLALDLSDMKYPGWEVTNLDPEYIYQAANYEVDAMDYRKTLARNWLYMGSMNFKMPYSFSGYPSELKLGYKLRQDIKDRDENRWQVKWAGDGKLTLDQFVQESQVEDFMNGNYTFGPEADGEKVLDFYEANVDGDLQRTLRWWDSEAQNYKNTENVHAYYLMTTHNVGKLMFLYGLRHEFTMAEYKGTVLKLDDDGDLESLERKTVDRNYNNLLPMAHIRYQLDPMTNARLAYTHTLARPLYWFITPRQWIDADGEEIEVGDPNLKPTTSHNVDLMLEHYFQGIGVAAGGFFYKKISDIVYEKEEKWVGGVWDDFDYTHPVNGGDATLYGVELAWSQELSFLPGFLNGFGIYANYTHTWAEANLGLDRKGFLPGQAGDVANVSLSYEKSGFVARFSAMYQGEYLMTVGKSEDWDEWNDAHLGLDVSVSYDLLPWLQLYANAVNLGNAPELEYYGIKDRPRVRDYYGWWMQGGIKITR